MNIMYLGFRRFVILFVWNIVLYWNIVYKFFRYNIVIDYLKYFILIEVGG